jgi:tripartite-type tricarboxylate transporter receptor subunit TctC
MLLGLCAAIALVGTTPAQEYPLKPIVLLVPFPPGGSTDVLARIISEPLRAVLGQTVIVQNVTGAGATIGVGPALQAAPDGYTLSIVKVFADPTVSKRLTDLGQDIPPRAQLTPETLGALHKSEIDKWWPLIRAENIKIE